MNGNIDSVCNIRLQSIRSDTVPEAVQNSDLMIDLRSDIESCDNENSENDYDKKDLLHEYNFERDIEKLIEVSKQFQTDYENEQVRSDAVSVDIDNRLSIPILNSNSLRRQKSSTSEVILPANDEDNFYFTNRSSKKENIFGPHSSQRSKSFTPKIPYPGPFGTGIIRPSPKKHSCVRKSETTSVKRSHRMGWSVRPYTSRYYNFDRTHPDLQLVESGDSIIPKRVSKEAAKAIVRAESGITRKPLLNNGLTWHEFFERCNVYSAKSLQSAYGDVPTATTATQSAVSELLTPKLNDNKIQKHILPQLNIRAECCVQRIPEISIAPCGFKRTVNTNIKLVEIIYEESDGNVDTIEKSSVKQIRESSEKEEQKISEPLQPQSNSERPPSVHLMDDNESVNPAKSQTSATCSSRTSSENNGYDSSFEESTSLNVSRVTAFTSGFTDNETRGRSRKNVGVQTHKWKIRTQRKKASERKPLTSPSHSSGRDISERDFSGRNFSADYLPQPLQVQLPTFPTNELIQMVDEIFDTSSDAVNVSYKYIVKETSVQTDIVWENINDLFKQQMTPKLEPTPHAVENQITESCAQADVRLANQRQTGDTIPSNVVNGSEKCDYRHRSDEGFCRHSRLKKIKICSCLACKSNIRFSSVNIDQSPQRTSNESSSSAAFDSRPAPAAKIKLLPSERYKRMKQAQREHFENDPRISKTLKKIYATARKDKARQDSTSSSSSGCYRRQLDGLPCDLSSYDDEILEPDLFTFSDEMLLFGLGTLNEIQYPSYLLKTESSQDTSESVDTFKYYAVGTGKQTLPRNKLFCTNSEDSSCNSIFDQRASDLEQCLLKDIENSGSDPAALSSLFSTSSLERKINEIHLEAAQVQFE